MKEFIQSEAKAETAILVALITKRQDERKTNEYLDELEFLAETAGAVTVKRFTQRVDGPSSITYVGKGKLEEIRQYIEWFNEGDSTLSQRLSLFENRRKILEKEMARLTVVMNKIRYKELLYREAVRVCTSQTIYFDQIP